MRVGIGLAVVLPGYAMAYGVVTGSPAPFDWDVAAVPGVIISIAAGFGNLMPRSQGPGEVGGG
jgi:hypothetical protein